MAEFGSITKFLSAIGLNDKNKFFEKSVIVNSKKLENPQYITNSGELNVANTYYY